MNTKLKMPIWKKILVGAVAVFFLLYILSVLFPIDYFEEGLNAYQNKDYKSALSNFSEVKKEDKNYNQAQVFIKQLKDSILTEAANSEELQSVSEKKESSKKGLKGTIGKSYDVGNLEYKVERVKFKKYIGDLFTFDKAHGIFLIITLTVTNKAKEQIIIDNSFFQLVDESGAVYSYAPDATATLELTEFAGETFMGLTINPYVAKKAKVVFEVPSKKKNYRLIFKDPFNFDTLEFDLKQ